MARPLDQIAIGDTALAPFVAGPGPANRAGGLLQQQKGAWELLRKGYESLQIVRTRTFDFDGFQIKIQFNPGRMTSTAAKVDATSIKERKCFLCPDNLPSAQQGILCDGAYLVLCNPFPIFPEHFTISALKHTPQRIADTFDALLNFARELGPRYTVLYNGPKCGASAPDHLHFQAGNRGFMPIDTEYERVIEERADRLFETGAIRVHSVERYLRRFIAFESPDAALLQRAFGLLYQAFQEGVVAGEEPLMNILAFYANAEWRIICFPRARHRPSFYFAEGEGKLLISPAAVEMGGICTTPREEDFDRVTREHILQLYGEVSVPEARFAGIKASLACNLGALC